MLSICYDVMVWSFFFPSQLIQPYLSLHYSGSSGLPEKLRTHTAKTGHLVCGGRNLVIAKEELWVK